MKPKHLPPAWNVNHKFERLFGEGSIFNEENSSSNETSESNLPTNSMWVYLLVHSNINEKSGLKREQYISIFSWEKQ